MPKNYFENRQICTMYPDGINVGDIVQIITKDKQGSKNKSDLIEGTVIRILSHGSYYRNGVKVELERLDNKVLVIGRVQYFVRSGQISPK
ncbi:TPA: DUF2196 domain-containing protein [Clostridium botulinum]|nr:DUF2196 domain-containing protein [Clostridium botulinum]